MSIFSWIFWPVLLLLLALRGYSVYFPYGKVTRLQFMVLLLLSMFFGPIAAMCISIFIIFMIIDDNEKFKKWLSKEVTFFKYKD